MTQGPAISTSGLPPPMAKSPIWTGGTGSLYRRERLELRGSPSCPSCLGAQGDAARWLFVVRGALRLTCLARLDEACKQRVGVQRFGLEIRVELHGQIPRMSRQLRNLHELAIGCSA